MYSWEANRLAVSGCAKGIREALSKLGKRCSLRWVYRQCEAPPDVKRLDYYGAFLLWYSALWMGNRAGADLLFEDFRSRVLALREADDLESSTWDQLLEQCEGEHSDIIRAVFRGEDMARLRVEIVEDIAAKRRLLAMVERREKQLPHAA